MKFCRIPFSETITFLCEKQVHIALWCWTAWVNSILLFPANNTRDNVFDITKFRNMLWSKNSSFRVWGLLFEGKNNIEFTYAVQDHNAMWTCISQRNVIVSENGILQNFIQNISKFRFWVYILPLIALLAFVYFSEMMNYVIGPVSPKFSPAISEELIENFIFCAVFTVSDLSDRL